MRSGCPSPPGVVSSGARRRGSRCLTSLERQRPWDWTSASGRTPADGPCETSRTCDFSSGSGPCSVRAQAGRRRCRSPWPATSVPGTPASSCLGRASVSRLRPAPATSRGCSVGSRGSGETAGSTTSSCCSPTHATIARSYVPRVPGSWPTSRAGSGSDGATVGRPGPTRQCHRAALKHGLSLPSGQSGRSVPVDVRFHPSHGR